MANKKENTVSNNSKQDSAEETMSPEMLYQLEEKLKQEKYKETFDRNILEKSFTKLYMTEPFFGILSMNVTKKVDWNMPTLYVGIQKAKHASIDPEFVLGVNPYFLCNLPVEQQMGCLKHEFYHLIFEHLTTFRTSDPSLAMLQNWAQDLSINSMLEGSTRGCLPEFALLPGREAINPVDGKPVQSVYCEYIKQAPKDKDSHFYFEELKKIKEEQEKKNGKDAADQEVMFGAQQGLGTLDDHGEFGELPEEVKEAMRQKMRQATQRAVEHCDREKNWGSISSEAQDTLRKLVSREVDWRSIMKNFLGRSRSVNRDSTIKKISKKQPYIFPGTKRTPRPNCVAFIDQSGSVSDDDVSRFMSEIESLADKTEVTVFNFDTEVDLDSKQVVTKSKPIKFKRTRCGGTDFSCISSFLNERQNRGKWSAVAVLTDGWAPPMSATPGKRVIFVITPDGDTKSMREGDLVIQMTGDKRKAG